MLAAPVTYVNGVRFMLSRTQGAERILLALSLLAWVVLALVVPRVEMLTLCLSSSDLIMRFGAGAAVLARSDIMLTEIG